MKIVLTATRRKETLGGIEYRVYTGITQTGIHLEMLGMFRIADPYKREQFQREVCSVGPADPPPVTLLSAHGLINP